jgi:hypothetical protein
MDYLGARMIPIDFGVKRSNNLEDEIARWFLGSKVLTFLSLSHNITHIDHPWKKMIPIEFYVKRSKVIKFGIKRSSVMNDEGTK